MQKQVLQHNNIPARQSFRSFRVIAGITLRQTLRSKRTIFILLITFLPVLIAIYHRIYENEAFANSGQAISHLMIFFMLFVSILVSLFYGTAVIADDIDNRTIIHLFTRPVRKYSIMLGKFVAYFIGVFLVLIPPIFLTFFVLATDIEIYNNFTDNFVLFFKQLCVIALAVIVYGSIFILFGTSLKRPVIFGLLLAFGWEKLAIIVPGIVRKFSVVHYLLSVFPENPEIRRIIITAQGSTSGFAFSIITLFAIAIVFFSLSTFIIHQKEYKFE